VIGFLLLLCAPLPGTGEPPSLPPLVDFRDPAEADRWIAVNDGVMGGVSRGGLRIPGGEPAIFSGSVSLDNNGGFASVRSLPRDWDLDGVPGVVLRVRGDGAVYRFRVRTDDGFDGVAYQVSFPTRAGEWERIPIRFPDLTPSFRGREVRAPALDPAAIRQIGFLIAGGQEGPFRLEIAGIDPLPPGSGPGPSSP
jgi:monofunctional biosynthetic peptidoglycan transglycosylase